MKAFLVIVVIAVCAFFWYRHTHAPAPARSVATPAPTRPPVSERAVSAADPAVPLYRAKQVVDKVQAQRKESGEYSDRR